MTENTGNEDEILTCPGCESTRIRETREAELVCQECGLVLEEDRVKESASRRAFTAEERQKKERTGSPITYTDPSRGMKTRIGSSQELRQVSPGKRGQYYRLKKWNRRLDESRQRRMKHALQELGKLVNTLNLPGSVLEESSRLYEKALEKDVVQGRNIENIVAALVYIVARNHGVPRTMSEISDEADISERELGKNYRYVARELDLRIVPVNPEDFVSRYAEELGLSGEIQGNARELISEAREKEIVAGKSPDSIVAAALYVAAKLDGRDITQKEVADSVDVTEVTVRKGYQDIVEGLDLHEELEQ